MQILKDRIRKDGKIKGGNVLKVDSFLNHQMDIKLFGEIGKEFKRRFADAEVNKILTIEASGIGIACIVAQYFDVPVVFAKKNQTKNIAGEVYTTKVESFTHGRVYDIIVAKEFLGKGDKVLIIDDFLANGKALEGLIALVRDSGAELVGAGIVIEKGFQVGGDLIRSEGIRLESLAIVDSMNKMKALFFDIDGTLLSEKTRQVPESAKEALKEARRRGHLVFINTGRVYCHLSQIRSEVEADGFLCGCGTCVVVQDQILYRHAIPYERGLQMKSDIDACGLDGILEGTEGCYMHKTPSRIPRVEELKNAIRAGGCVIPHDWEDEGYVFDKIYLGSDENSRPKELFGRMKDMEIIDRGNGFYECVPRGHSKATAIDQVLKHCGISLEDAYVFGDSSNDLSMFRYASNCVLMGHHSPVLEPYASFVTKTVEEDGIAYAMKELGII